MPQAVNAKSTNPTEMTAGRFGRGAHAAGAGFDSILALLHEPAGGVGPGPETIGRQPAGPNPGDADLDDLAAEEMRTASEGREHLKRRDARRTESPSPAVRSATRDNTHAKPEPAASSADRSATQSDKPSSAVQPAAPSASSGAPAAAPSRTDRPPPAAVAGVARASLNAASPAAAAPGGRAVAAVSGVQGSGKALLAKLADRQKPPILRATKEEPPAQVSRALARIVSQGGGRITLRLNPHALGEVRVDVEMRGGVANARLNTRTESARELLSADLDSLRAALERRGVSVERLEVIGPEDDSSPRTDAETARNGDHPRGAGESSKHGRSAAPRTQPAEPDAQEGNAAEGAGCSIESPPIRTDADGVVRVDAIA